MAWNRTPFNYNGRSPTQIKDDLDKANENFSIISNCFLQDNPETQTAKNSDKLQGFQPSTTPQPNTIPVSLQNGRLNIEWIVKLFQTLTITGATVVWDLQQGINAQITLTSNITLTAQNLTPGMTYNLIVRQDQTGNKTITFGSMFKFANNVAPQISTEANKITIISFISDGINLYGTAIGGF